MREEAEQKAKAEAEAAQKAAEQDAKAQAEAEQNADITLVDALPGTTAGLWFRQCDGHAGSDSHPLCRKPRCRRPTPERPQRRDLETTFIS